MSKLPVVVIKVGTRLIREERHDMMGWIAKTIEECKTTHRIVIVSSGAIGLGMEAEKMTQRPTDSAALQCLATIGQGHLISLWKKSLNCYNRNVAQILLTHRELAHKAEALEIARQFNMSLDRGAVPVVNENDGVSNKEITFGDNDLLAARLSCLLGAQRLILLTNTAGLLNQSLTPPNLIKNCYGISEETYALAGAAGSSDAKGGMRSKLLAAAIASLAGVHTHIMPGKKIGELSLGESLVALLKYKTCHGTTIFPGYPMGPTVVHDMVKELGLAIVAPSEK